MWSDRGTVIGRLRVLGPNLDPVVAGLRAQAALSEFDARHDNLSRSACLFIRRLDDPLPESVSLRRGGEPLPARWKQAFEHKLDLLARTAARPARGIVPAASNAVLFADRSELLACLARDWCDGTLIGRWWWREILRRTDTSRVVIEYWLSAPEYVPAAIDLLDRTGDALRFVAALAASDVVSLLKRVAHTHGLASLMPVPAGLSSSGASGRGESGQGAEGKSEAPKDPASFMTDLSAFRFLPQTVCAQLTMPQCILFDICLGLRRAPLIVRSGSYAAALTTVLKALFNGPVHGLAKSKANRPASSELGESSVAGSVAAAEHDLDDKPPVSDDLSQIVSDEPPQELRRPDLPLSPHEREMADGAGMAARGFADSKPATKTQPGRIAAEGKPLKVVADTFVVRTRLGGAFYLVNLGIFLELYRDFTSPLRPGIALSIWDFIALVTARFVPRGYRKDALWSLLAKLAARPAEQAPGADFAPPGEWRMPDSWLAPFGGSCAWQATSDGIRLRVVHPAGFPVLDVALESGDPGMQLAREMSLFLETARTNRLPEWGASSAGVTPSRDTPLTRWLGWLMAYIRARLAPGLGLDATRNPGRLLCCHEARVTLTPAHLDVSFSLAALPIEIRLSGLDRDPGWVPAAGRVIRFHYQ